MSAISRPRPNNREAPGVHFSRLALMAVFIASPWFLLGGLGYCAALVVRSIGDISRSCMGGTISGILLRQLDAAAHEVDVARHQIEERGGLTGR
jgi:hypothetical protein